MALVPCRECKEPVSRSAKSCPRCGIANPGLTAGAKAAGCLTAVLIIGAAAYGIGQLSDGAGGDTGAASVPVVASAPDFTDQTACPVIVSAMDAKDMATIHAAALFILNAMETADDNHVEAGEPGIFAKMSDKGRTDMIALTSVHCRLHPKETVFNAAMESYNGARELEMGLGVDK